MRNTTGLDEDTVTPEVERYMGVPGQACAYKVGQLKILELRDKARAALGPKFDLKDFHAVVLEGSPMPLTILEQQIDEWIARSRAAGWRDRGRLVAATDASAPKANSLASIYWGTIATRIHPDPAARAESQKLVDMLLGVAPTLASTSEAIFNTQVPPSF